MTLADTTRQAFARAETLRRFVVLKAEVLAEDIPEQVSSVVAYLDNNTTRRETFVAGDIDSFARAVDALWESTREKETST